MLETIELFPGIRLHCIQSDRFKQGVLSIYFLRPMRREEAAKNALIPEILLRGCQTAPDLRQITARLDDLYGASVSAQVRRLGNVQTVGMSCYFVDDRFALPGDRVLEPMADFLKQMLTAPVLENGCFCREFVSGEKRNLISAIEAQRNDKQAYAVAKLLENMCKGDDFSVPRLGEISQVRKLTAQAVFDHYRQLLRESPVEIFYVGAASAQQVAQWMSTFFADVERGAVIVPQKKPFVPAKPSHRSQRQDIAQGKLAMGFVTPITHDDSRFAAMQVCNNIFGAGMNSKLFANLREKRSLCYVIGSGFYSSKGLMTVHAGIDTCRFEETRDGVLEQLELCKQGQISQQEMTAAKEMALSGLRSVYDSPGAMEMYFSSSVIGGMDRTPETHIAEIQAVTMEDVVDAARTVTYHSSFFLKGADHE